ncbi:MAG TPA: thermonuclease family protein [Methylocaldum sp.]|nr:thermonuclease family protein [Methylocaldum sp.]
MAVSFAASANRLNSYAFVNDDGSLRIRGQIVRLYGLSIPPTARICWTFIRPIQCAPRASLALDLKIGTRFVDCETLAKNADGSLTAVCRVNGEDLGAWMLAQGWALALPDAPVEYLQLEGIARQRGVGVWGIPVDRVHPLDR